MAGQFACKSFWRVLLPLAITVACFFVAGCNRSNDETTIDSLKKITFDIAAIDEDGLYGPPDGLRALDYEFCIPANESCVKEVSGIDPTVKIHRVSPGRIGCSEAEYLCIGNSHQKDFKKVLQDLAALEYIERIDICVYE